jgi:hypothetical protein
LKKYPTFDLEFYRKFYPDFGILFIDDKYLIMKHYYYHGLEEGRLQNSADFDPKFYNNFYLDIK